VWEGQLWHGLSKLPPSDFLAPASQYCGPKLDIERAFMLREGPKSSKCAEASRRSQLRVDSSLGNTGDHNCRQSRRQRCFGHGMSPYSRWTKEYSEHKTICVLTFGNAQEVDKIFVVCMFRLSCQARAWTQRDRPTSILTSILNAIPAYRGNNALVGNILGVISDLVK
jgi:hypothetical protein